MLFHVLGPIRAEAEGGEATLTRREQLLLAMLVTHANEPVRVDAIVDAVWGDTPPRNARNQVQGCVSRLRKNLSDAGVSGQVVVTGSGGYELRVDPECVDLLRFRRSVAEARVAAGQGRSHEAAERYQAALAMWHGPALAGAGTELLRKAGAVLEEERLRATEERIEVELALDRGSELVADLTDLVSRHPYRESLHAALMLALYRSHRQADALAAYQRVYRSLVEEVGTEPGPVLRDLHQRILNSDPSLRGPAAPGGDHGGRSARHCLPRAVGDFTGRPDEVARLLTAAGADPTGPTVLAIDGMPGVGKTALAVHVAHLLAGSYPDAQLFIDLLGHSEQEPVEPAAALHTLLLQLGVPGGRVPRDLADRISLWRDEMAGRRALLVLDNAAGAAQVSPLLPAGTGCLVLVTSRRRLLGLDAARPVSLGVLPGDQAVALLAQIVGDRLRAEPDAAAEVVERCGRLPLAIRLAGARLAHRPSWRVQDLADRLGDDREMLTELAAEDRTVADAFALSYVQLAPEQRRVFRLLSLHPGESFDGYAVAALADVSLAAARAALDDLVERHLVEEPRPGRYRLHDLLREYARRLALSEAGTDCRAAVERLLDYYLHATVGAGGVVDRPASRGSLQMGEPIRLDLVSGPAALGMDWAVEERPTLVAAVRCAVAAGLDDYAWRLARALWGFVYHRGYLDDLVDTHRCALEAAERLADERAIATTCNYLASAYDRIGEFDTAVELLERSISLQVKADDRIGVATARMNLASVKQKLGEMAEAVRLHEQALAAKQAVGDIDGMGTTLHNLGLLHTNLGRYPEAARCHRRSLAIARERGDLAGCANALGDLGAARTKLGEYGPAGRLLMASLRLKRRIGFRGGEVDVVNDLGVLHRALGRCDEAMAWHAEALALAQDLGDRSAVCMTRNDLGRTLRESGDTGGALGQHRVALTEASKMRFKYENARALDGIAACLRNTEPDAARNYWLRALHLYRQMGVPEQSDVERHLAELRDDPDKGR
jgi:DNA-binding SARP family transcriptional activator/tetratricopeptide (TPR) repeat protein